ncbi:MAG: AarF/UbiB family protein [Gammaproteobacteria bacterium]|nr:AarF/UbiB family protein [Gammaproteobacteria bacterium]MDH5802331.1 AarF/UbiB family protein [Gammaproteobacteria bacterium]
MLWETLKVARDIGRLHEIASVLIRYGFGDVVQRLGMGRMLEQAGKVLRWKDAENIARMHSAERIRHACEEMGPTFIKMGQILATRVDIFPQDWIREFEKLQDTVPAQDFELIRPQIEEDLGDKPENIFTNLNTEALAAGSIAQVYEAQLPGGEDVVLKIRRPGIRAIVEADLRLLSKLAELLEKEIPEARRFHPVEVIRQVKLSLRRELDLAVECRNAERLAEIFSQDPHISLPKVFWDWTGERVNVQERIRGIPGRDLHSLQKAGFDRQLLAQRGAAAVLNMVLKHGFFHADPHPGNIFYVPENCIVFIDTGMVGRLSERRKEQVIDLVRGLISKDTALVVDVIQCWSDDSENDIDSSKSVNTESLAMEIDNFMDNYHSVALKELNLATMLTDLTVIMREHALTMPADLALLLKVFITLEGLGRQLDPDFDMVSEAMPFIRSEMLSRYKPEQLAKRTWRHINNIADLLGDLPRDLRRLLQSARKGALQVHVDITRLEQFGRELDKAANRLTIGLVTSALIIGTSIVMTVEGGPTMFGLPLFGFLGFLFSGIGGVWLLFSIWRSGRGTR